MQNGYLAQRLLSRHPTGNVIAVFDRSAYLELDEGIVCLTADELPDGPLMVSHRRTSALRIDEKVTPETEVKSVWRPPTTLGWSIQSLERGLFSNILSGEPEYLLKIAIPEVERALSGWLERCFSGYFVAVPKAATRLVGLGPGLTPSGDDYLGGVMVALLAVGQPDIASALYASLDLSRTNRISAAHLAAAYEGAAAAPLHDVVNAVLQGRTERLSDRRAARNVMGHSSGWDAFAGCKFVLRTYYRSAKIRTLD